MSILKLKDSQGNWIGVPTIKGNTGNGISSAVLNNDYTLTLTFTDGTTYTTPSIRGEKGEQGEPATDMDIHICSASEYDSETRIPTITSPDDKTFYLVPTEDGTSPDLFTEWVYVNNAWEMFGSASVDLTDYVKNTDYASANTGGVVKVDIFTSDYQGGIATIDNKLNVIGSSATDIKSGLYYNKPVVAGNQHESTFYGLAKVAGHDEKDSTLPVGQYTDEAKSSIQDMLDVPSNADLNEVEEKVDQNTEDLLKAFPTDTASGAVASFPDGADNLPLKSLVVDINPVQDLHGQDTPYPAGGGVNLFPFEDYFTEGWTNTLNGITATYSNGYVKVTGTSTSDGWTNIVNVSFSEGFLIEGGGSYALPSYLTIRARVDGSNVTTNKINIFSVNQSLAIFGFYIAVTSGATVNWNVPMMLIKGTSNPTEFSPYENICPISGWTGANVNVTGYNIWDEEWESGTLRYGNPASNASRIRSKNYIVCKPNTTYYFNRGTNNGNMWVYFYDRDKVCLNPTMNGNNVGNSAVTTPDKCCYIRFFLSAQTEYQHDVAINYPSTDHDYHPFVGRSIPVSWQTEAGTVYGGRLDVLSGVLTVYPYYASYNGETLTGRWISDRDMYAVGTTPTIGAQVVNIGAQGTEIQLEPHEVASLLGANNIWADTGDTSVEYCADTEMYIEKVKPVVNVDDVQINGTSIVQDGVANVPVASNTVLGVVRTDSEFGTGMYAGKIFCAIASEAQIKAGRQFYRPICPDRQHQSVFYGLAKASGDTTQSQSSNAVGNYTDNAKDSIQNMLGITPLIAPHESDPFESAHAIGELFIINGKLYRAKTALAVGEYINEGTNVEVVNTSDVYVKNTDWATEQNAGIVKVLSQYGIAINNNSGHYLYLNPASSADIKGESMAYKAIAPYKQHESVFYGLAKIAGHDENNSTLPVGTYTEEAKTAIKQMLDIHDTIDSFVEEVTGTDVTITGQPSYRYNCGELYSLTVTPPSSGTIDIRFTSGSTPTVLTLPQTVKMPEWWVEVEANTIYEMCITDGIYCGVMSWAI